MTSIKDPIEKLREYTLCKDFKSMYTQYCPSDELADEIEAQYLKLPVDADGVPIHIGDYLQGVYSEFEVCAVSEHYAYWGEGKHFDRADCCRHVKPDTVDGLLEEFMYAVKVCGCERKYCEDEIADYAERIRKAVDGTEERDRLRAEVKRLGEQLDRLRNDEGVA